MGKYGTNQRSVVITAALCTVGIGVGILIGHYGIAKPTKSNDEPVDDVKIDATGMILSNVDNNTISDYLKVSYFMDHESWSKFLRCTV